jgi:hypothetical protein
MSFLPENKQKMDEIQKIQYNAKRRDFLLGSAIGLGGIALQGLVGCKSKPEAVKKENKITFH